MTLYSGPTQPTVTSGQISPNFGVQSGGAIPAAVNPVIAIPAGMTALEAAGRAIAPLNANVSTVNGLSVGAGDICSLSELLSGGNGTPSMRGAPLPPSGGLNDQQFTAGTSAQTLQVNGPTPTNTEPQTLGPVSGAVLGSNIALTPNSFNG